MIDMPAVVMAKAGEVSGCSSDERAAVVQETAESPPDNSAPSMSHQLGCSGTVVT
jgi:hypothetical protein